MRKVLIVDDVYESLIHGLENNGFEVIYLPNINKSAVADKIKDVQPEGIVVRSKILIERPLLDNLDSVKWVARAGAGIDNIDQNYLNQKNIEIFDASGANANSVAEHMLGMLLSYLHKIPRWSGPRRCHSLRLWRCPRQMHTLRLQSCQPST